SRCFPFPTLFRSRVGYRVAAIEGLAQPARGIPEVGPEADRRADRPAGPGAARSGRRDGRGPGHLRAGAARAGGRFALRVAAPGAAALAGLARARRRGDEGGPALAVGREEIGPPPAELLGRLAGLDAQHQEVVARAQPHVLGEAVRRLAAAPLEARLEAPDLAHVGDESLVDRQLAGLRLEHLV